MKFCPRFPPPRTKILEPLLDTVVEFILLIIRLIMSHSFIIHDELCRNEF